MQDSQQTFTLEEAQKMLPELRVILIRAKDELDESALAVELAERNYQLCEAALASYKDKEKGTTLRELRENFEKAIESLSQAQQQYINCLNDWIENISAKGVILRDIKSGLLDFPARNGEFEYFLCWRQEEDEIAFWHLVSDGFVGRRPLAVLAEYI